MSDRTTLPAPTTLPSPIEAPTMVAPVPTSTRMPIRSGTVLGSALPRTLTQAADRLEASAAGDPSATGALATALVIAETIAKMPFEVNLWQAQNIWNDLLRRSDTNYWTPEWKEDFKKLGNEMNICVDRLVIEEGVSAF